MSVDFHFCLKFDFMVLSALIGSGKPTTANEIADYLNKEHMPTYSEQYVRGLTQLFLTEAAAQGIIKKIEDKYAFFQPGDPEGLRGLKSLFDLTRLALEVGDRVATIKASTKLSLEASIEAYLEASKE